MTAQISDSLSLSGREYSLIGIERYWPFSPQEEGFSPVMPHTACWRGYYCQYAVTSAELFLDSLYVGLGNATAPRWRGIEPQGTSDDEMWLYAGVRMPLDYSGGVIVGRGFLREYYVHMGFQPAYAYDEVRELVFSNGRLVEDSDRSARMAEIRDEMAAGATAAPPTMTPDEIERFVARAFSRSYDETWF